MTEDNLKLLALALLLGVSLFQLNRLVVKNLPKVKPGADVVGLDPVMDRALLAIESVASTFGARGVVTSGLDTSPNRLPTSLHPAGKAVDARRVDWPTLDNRQIAMAQRNKLADTLGPDYDVVLESNHIHIEFDPQGVSSEGLV